MEAVFFFDWRRQVAETVCETSVSGTVEWLVATGGQWGSHWVRSHAERRRQDGEVWAAVEVGNGLADRKFFLIGWANG